MINTSHRKEFYLSIWNKKKGFTLAEVLITLGIIGIVAAMTLPTLITKFNEKRTLAILREDYSILANMMQMARDTGNLTTPKSSNNITQMKDWFQKTLQPHIKTVNVCYDEYGCWADSVYYLDGKKNKHSSNGCGQKTISFTLYNGSAICFDDYEASQMRELFGYETTDGISYLFYVDVNGRKSPNTIGKDIFLLIYDTKDDTISTAGASKTNNEVIEDCLTGTGIFCATYAKRHGWTLPKK